MNRRVYFGQISVIVPPLQVESLPELDWGAC